MFSKMSYYVNKLCSRPRFYVMTVLGRSRLVRTIVPWVSNRRLATPTLETTSLFSDLDVNQVTTDLKRDGCAFGIDLPKSAVDEILQFAQQTQCYGNRQKTNGFFYPQRQAAEAKIGQRIMLGFYYNTANECSAIARLQRDPKLWEIARNYLGTCPRHIGNQLWWSFAGEAAQKDRDYYAQMFHQDLDDYGFMKFFFYLTDVDDTAGPHVCVRGTHRKKNWRHQFQYPKRFSDEEIIASYGAANVITINGSSGNGFAEDTYCLHKGTTPTKKDRLVLQVQFAINDYGVQNDAADNNQLVSLFPAAYKKNHSMHGSSREAG